jgi:hypothetical protein
MKIQDSLKLYNEKNSRMIDKENNNFNLNEDE